MVARFATLKDLAEIDCLSRQPTGVVLPSETADRLRAAAGTIISGSPEVLWVLKDAAVKEAPGPAKP
ncbi:MAG: hypothetical protein J0M00_12510 [Burkholderiales bacterium]|nr:hypothetical protein [Burkholderiales bacterium]